MISSRIKRYDEQKQTKRMALAIGGTVALIVFFALFGVKLLIGFSLLVDNVRGTTKEQQTEEIILPPELNPILEATNSATIKVTGKGENKTTAILYVNDVDQDKKVIGEDGTFVFESVRLTDGANTIVVRAQSEKNTLSNPSEAFSIVRKSTKPVLEINSPEDKKHISGETNTIEISGKTEESTKVTVNDRFVMVKSDGSFSFNFPLGEGDTKLNIVATDIAGNQTTVERMVSYSK